MKNKKLIALAGVTLTTAVMLTGCGNNDVKTYDKERTNIATNISEMTGENVINEVIENEDNVNSMVENNVAKNNTIKENNITQNKEVASIFKGSSSLKYKSNLKDDENGKIAILKMGEDIFKTEVKDGYYTYVDNFNNSYNIKQIKSITSKYYMTGNNNGAILFKCTVNYIDNNNSNKSFEAAVTLTSDSNSANMIVPFENYTGTTSFVRGFSDLSEDESEQTFTKEELSQMALNYFEKKYGYRENGNGERLNATVFEKGDGTLEIIIHDYDTVENNAITSYTVDMTGKGTDPKGNKIDLNQ
ncbi:MAG: hypothetical protein J6A89_03035 [Clostridia bacterium]|nr:hypothetical protein [Clostridia bacterium]